MAKNIKIKGIYISHLIIAACMISVILQFIPGYTELLTLSRYSFFYQHHYWTILTHMFLHGGPSHLLFNMLALFFIGPELERRIGDRNFSILYLLSGIFAGFGHIITSPYGVIGASGAIYGILACLAILVPYMTIYVYFIPIKIIYIIPLFVLIDLLMIPYGGGIAHVAHLSGLLVGIIFGIGLRRGPGRI